MSHGFSGVKEQGLADIAERSRAAGFAVLVFDFRHFGASDGAPLFPLHLAEVMARRALFRRILVAIGVLHPSPQPVRCRAALAASAAQPDGSRGSASRSRPKVHDLRRKGDHRTIRRPIALHPVAVAVARATGSPIRSQRDCGIG
jgi:hypothetical protein